MVAIKHTREKWWNSIAVNPREPFLREIPGNLVRAARIMMSNKRRYTPYAGNPCEGHLRSFFRHPWADHFFFSRGTKGIALTRRMNGGERMHGTALNKRWQNLLYSLGKQFFFFSRLHASSLYRVKKKKRKKKNVDTSRDDAFGHITGFYLLLHCFHRLSISERNWPPLDVYA